MFPIGFASALHKPRQVIVFNCNVQELARSSYKSDTWKTSEPYTSLDFIFLDFKVQILHSMSQTCFHCLQAWKQCPPQSCSACLETVKLWAVVFKSDSNLIHWFLASLKMTSKLNCHIINIEDLKPIASNSLSAVQQYWITSKQILSRLSRFTVWRARYSKVYRNINLQTLFFSASFNFCLAHIRKTETAVLHDCPWPYSRACSGTTAEPLIRQTHSETANQIAWYKILVSGVMLNFLCIVFFL